ncbi:MAG TPA: ion transporter [Chthoniobacterales bacterium]|jgi:voltage-gated sodium channel
MSQLAQRIVASRPFHASIITVILLAGVLVGVETDAGLVARHGALLHVLDVAVLAVFIAEIVLKFAAHGRRPLDFFRDSWNVFDFAIVAVCLLPIGGQFAAVLRLVRTLRLLRLVSALPKLQLLVGALIKSLSSMGYVGLLLGLIFYIYAVTGVHLFGQASPGNFGNLPSALLSLFQMITLGDWRNLYNGAHQVGPFAATIYFVSFILLGTMIMLNLFIGIVMNSMAEMHTELDEQKQATRTEAEKGGVLSDITLLDEQLAGMRSQLDALRNKLSQSPPHS